METLYLLQSNLPRALEVALEETFSFYHPDVLPMNEVVAKFETKFEGVFNPDTYEYSVTEETLQDFMTDMGEILFERIMADGVKTGDVEVLHDGNDFVFKLVNK